MSDTIVDQKAKMEGTTTKVEVNDQAASINHSLKNEEKIDTDNDPLDEFEHADEKSADHDLIGENLKMENNLTEKLEVLGKSSKIESSDLPSTSNLKEDTFTKPNVPEAQLEKLNLTISEMGDSTLEDLLTQAQNNLIDSLNEASSKLVSEQPEISKSSLQDALTRTNPEVKSDEATEKPVELDSVNKGTDSKGPVSVAQETLIKVDEEKGNSELSKAENSFSEEKSAVYAAKNHELNEKADESKIISLDTEDGESKNIEVLGVTDKSKSTLPVTGSELVTTVVETILNDEIAKEVQLDKIEKEVQNIEKAPETEAIIKSEMSAVPTTKDLAADEISQSKSNEESGVLKEVAETVESMAHEAKKSILDADELKTSDSISLEKNEPAKSEPDVSTTDEVESKDTLPLSTTELESRNTDQQDVTQPLPSEKALVAHLSENKPEFEIEPTQPQPLEEEASNVIEAIKNNEQRTSKDLDSTESDLSKLESKAIEAELVQKVQPNVDLKAIDSVPSKVDPESTIKQTSAPISHPVVEVRKDLVNVESNLSEPETKVRDESVNKASEGLKSDADLKVVEPVPSEINPESPSVQTPISISTPVLIPVPETTNEQLNAETPNSTAEDTPVTPEPKLETSKVDELNSQATMQELVQPQSQPDLPKTTTKDEFDELGLTEQEALQLLKEEKQENKAKNQGYPLIQLYGSSVSGNMKIKKAQSRMINALERFNVKYEFVDLAADDEAKKYIKRKNPTSTAIPQLYLNGEFKMEYEEFDELLEYDELLDELGVDYDF